MEVKNCKGCGTLFNYIGGAPLCANCQKDLEEKFDLVKQYIYDNPGANISQVADDNEVTVSQIKKWVREERLEFTESSSVQLDCESCGKPVRTGKYCPACKDKMQNRFGDMYREAKPEVKKQKRDGNRMRFLDS